MAKKNMYGCQVGGLSALYYVHLAKLKLSFQNSLPGSRLRLATEKFADLKGRIIVTLLCSEGYGRADNVESHAHCD